MNIRGNEKRIIIGFLLLAVIIAGCVVSEQSRSGINSEDGNTTAPQTTVVPTAESGYVGDIISHNLVLNAPSIESVDTVMVYRTIPPVVNEELTLDYAKKFNVTGTLRGETTVQSEDLRYYVMVTKNSGSVEYSDQDRPNEKQDAPQYLPSDEEAIEIATKFLKEKDLYPDGAKDPVAKLEYAYSRDKVVFGQIGVWYHRYLNGLEVKGTQLMVGVGGNGDVIEYFANWRDYEPYKEYPVISVNEAFEKMKTEGVNAGRSRKDALVSFDEAYLAYLTEAAAYTEEYLEPIWVFKGDVMLDGKSVMDVVEYIPALAEVPVELNYT